MPVTPKTMARQITVSSQQRQERARIARVAPRTRLAYSTSTGDTRHTKGRQEHAQRVAECWWLAQDGAHCLWDVEADLPGDRSVGYCECGEYVDTGTFDERNAE